MSHILFPSCIGVNYGPPTPEQVYNVTHNDLIENNKNI